MTVVVSKTLPKIMGILNVTPDSFYDGGAHHSFEPAMSHAWRMIKEGADIIDVGGEATHPGALPVTISQECDRVIPIIERLARETNIPISIDSSHPEVIQAALEAGASIVNDVRALQKPGALAVVAKKQVPVCLMHMQGAPQTMQASPTYENVLAQVYDFFVKRINECEKAGILKENIWIDPGFGFGKSLEHNLTLLGNLSYFKSLGCPLLIGISRKIMFGKILNVPANERLYGSLAGAVLAAVQGAAIIRVHDVAATKDALAVVRATLPYWQSRGIKANVCTA